MGRGASAGERLGARFAARKIGRWAALGVLVSALAACTERRTNIGEQFFPLIRDSILGPPELPPPRKRTRAETDQIRFATIALARLADPERRTLLVPIANNAGFLSYADQSRRGVVIFGGLVTATKGLLFDMTAIKHQSDDPIARMVPLDRWPRVVVRNYQFTRLNTSDYEVSVTCVFNRIASEQIEIIERTYDVTRVQETCANPQRDFTNTYWVEPDTGFIWKSEQWLGPKLEPYVVEVVRPFNRGVRPRQK